MVPGPGRRRENAARRTRWAGSRLIFVPAPLPVSAIEEILFQSREDSTACKNDAQDFGQRAAGRLRDAGGPQVFRRSGRSGRGRRRTCRPNVSPPLAAAHAAGGMLAMLRMLAWSGRRRGAGGRRTAGSGRLSGRLRRRGSPAARPVPNRGRGADGLDADRAVPRHEGQSPCPVPTRAMRGDCSGGRSTRSPSRQVRPGSTTPTPICSAIWTANRRFSTIGCGSMSSSSGRLSIP